MKIVEFLEDSSILIKDISETIENLTEEQKRGFLGTKCFSFQYVRKCFKWKRCDSCKWQFLIRPHPLTNFEININYQNKPRFNCAFFKK